MEYLEQVFDFLEKESCPQETAAFMTKTNEKLSKQFTFPELNYEDRRSKIWRLIFQKLEDKRTCPTPYLETIRILSRDKSGLNELMCEKRINILLQHAGLASEEDLLLQQINQQRDYSVILEAQKCMCNLLFNSAITQSICSKNNLIPGIVLRLKTYKDPQLPQPIKLFDMRMLFLITALRAETRTIICNEYHGFTYLMEVLDLLLKECNNDIELSDECVDLSCEILKVLFNTTVQSDSRQFDEEEEAHFMRLTDILHDLLLCHTRNVDKQEELVNHTVNLLTNVPRTCLEELVTPVNPKDCPCNYHYEGSDMQAINSMLGFLDLRTNTSLPHRSLKEGLIPILTVLGECIKVHRPTRKWLRQQILPPLTDIYTRPEEGGTIRNKLCRLLTTSIPDVRTLVADFLFVLCKENVGRMIKYTGYGNAAGLLANRGLMQAEKSNRVVSSDSDESDTEEYKKYRDQINPVTGCFEPPHPSAMEGMTDEQKEYEAMQLVDLMEKMASKQIIQPCRIGEDGRPHPVEHILQLQDQINDNTTSPIDSD